MADDDKAPPHIQHQDPPVFYCWKYWMQTGEVREGCTPIEPQDNWPDLNDYGWVYIVVPIAAIFILVFITYLICSKAGKSNPQQKQSVLLESDDSDDDIDAPPPPRNKYARGTSYLSQGQVVHAVPIRKSKAEDFYTVVQMAKPDNNAAAPNRKVAPRGGVTSPVHPGQAKLYPKLSTMRRTADDELVNVNGRKLYTKSPPVEPASNPYVNDPSVPFKKAQQKKPSSTKVVEEFGSSSSEDDVTDNEIPSADEKEK